VRTPSATTATVSFNLTRVRLKHMIDSAIASEEDASTSREFV